MRNEALGTLLFRELEKIRRNPDWKALNQIDASYQLLSLIFVEATKQERLRFSTLFSRIAFASQKYRLSRALQFYIHTFRKQAGEILFAQELPADRGYLPELGFQMLQECIAALFGGVIPDSLTDLIGRPWPYPHRPVKVQSFRSNVRVVALEDYPLEKQLLIKDEAAPESDLRMQYDLADYNELFTPAIELMRRITGFPVTLELIDVEIGQDGVYRPRAMVLEPDYLADVTAIAECFKDYGAVPEIYLIKKYLPFKASVPLLQGNIANFMLDELMCHIDAPYRETFIRNFQLNPLAFASISDQEVKELYQKSKKHFVNLRQVILRDFPALGIQSGDCYLEPSFYSSVYGIQGRLDVLYHQGNKSAIVELKSGKIFKPNGYGINLSHYIQTLLYDLIIRSAFGRELDPANYILYSGEEQRPLRYAPVVKAQQYEALQARNQILGIEYQMASLGSNAALGRTDILAQGKRWLQRLHPARFAKADQFVVRDIENFLSPLQKADETELRYFFAFSGFIAREHKLAKTGIEGLENVNGQAALWRSRMEEKENNFDILSYLNILDNQASAESATIRFGRTERTNRLANFRVGDIAVLYPLPEDGQAPLFNQLFKCSIIAISAEDVTVQLRARQFNDQLFRTRPFWNLEHDLMDNSFLSMYRGLYDFLNSTPRQRQLVLGRIPPDHMQTANHPAPVSMTEEQKQIFSQILVSKDYFLLWGPPGTGKTSVMLKYLTGHWLTHTRENLLLLAYTNRAVDEICAAIESFDPAVREQYLRIGSRHSTAPEFRDRLLQVQAEQVQSRKELRELIDRHRIIVGTVASVTGKNDLLTLKSFDRVIIDEASQIPEPLLAGFLPQFRYALLIGDHKQLPAVVQQDEALSAVEDAALNELGISNLRNSLFERLYKRCQAQGWHWAYARLSHQGRMHQEVMAFPNAVFYEGMLRILPEAVQGHQVQIRTEWLPQVEVDDPLYHALASGRMLFFATPGDEQNPQQKTNLYEARLVRDIVRAYQRIYAQQGRTFGSGTLGIITPYRAQIAQIRHALEEAGLDSGALTIDTVERYQGGARDIIVISLCTNSPRQMRALVSLSEEGIDRKLNVALTRAREAVVILGNPALLESNAVYKALLDSCRRVDFL